MSETLNPYIAGSPITGPEMFFGREDVFTFVRQALTGQHRDHVLVLYGQRRTGKTSVLYQMSRQLGEHYVCIFTDLHGLSLNGLGGFLWELANHITRVLRREYQMNLPVLDRAAFQDEPRSAFEDTFLDSVWAAIGERHLLLMLDEAIRLEEQVQAGKLEIDIFDYLRHLMQHYPQLDFLFSLGSGLEEMQKEYAFLFNVALYKKISFLEHAAAVALITEPVKDRCPFQPAAVERILEVTSGHPYFTQLLCHSLFNRCQGESGISAADVDGVLDEAVERGLAVLKHVWEESTPGEKAIMAALAAAGASTAPAPTASLPDVAPTPSGSKANPGQIIQIWAERGVTLPESEVSRAVRSLVARDVISDVSSAGTFAFTVDLLRLWVQKFRRLDWVKEEIEDAIEAWTRRDQERHDREVEREALVQSRKINAPQNDRPEAVNSAAGNVVPRKPLRLPIINIILALAGLLAIVYFASGLLARRAADPATQISPASQPGGASSTTLRGDAAKVSDLAVLGGYVWAATEGGLVRWSADGTYQLYSGNEVGLDCINAIAVNPADSTLWLGCGGVSVMHVQGDKLEQVGYYNRDDGLGTGSVRALALDHHGIVWAGGSPDAGHPPPLTAFLGKPADKPWQPDEAIDNRLSKLFANSPESMNISAIFIDSTGGFWLGLRQAGIIYTNGQTASAFSQKDGVGKPGLQDSRIRQILVDKNGTVWAAASDQGLLRLKTGSRAWETVALVPSSTPVNTVAEFADGSLWAGGNHQVEHSSDGGATWTQVGSQEGLGSDIGALVQDAVGRVWAGAYNGGVSYWDGQRWHALQQ